MDCPNCGAYNASSSSHCRRCGRALHPEQADSEEQSDWRPADDPDDNWSEWQPAGQGEPNPWAWSEPEAAAGDQLEQTGGTAAGSAATDDQPESMATDDPGATTDIPNYLWPAVAATLCCCAPLGIPAIIYASRVDTYAKSGDRDGAMAASERAKKWLIASVSVALVFWAVFITTSSL